MFLATPVVLEKSDGFTFPDPFCIVVYVVKKKGDRNEKENFDNGYGLGTCNEPGGAQLCSN